MRVSHLVVASLALSGLVATGPWLDAGAAAPVPGAFTVSQVVGFPFPENLTPAPVGSVVAWTLVEQGQRNIYVAEGPAFTPRRLTNYTKDDGQELTSLRFSDDGQWMVYVRGGDHGSNWAAEGNLPPNPASLPVQPRVQVWSVRVAGGTPTLLGDGDHPALAPKSHVVAFERDRRIWSVPIDGSKAAAQLFFARGASEAPTWSPDGKTLAFVSNRDDHSFITLFTDDQTPLVYLAPTTSRDARPVWSADGKRVAFIRRPGRGGARRSPLETPVEPWSICVADVATASAREVWHSGTKPADGLAGDPGLSWAAGDRLVFRSYADGWQHLYSVPSAGGPALRLTTGDFMVETFELTPDGKAIVYGANSGGGPNDIDRRHTFRVPVDAATPVALSSGAGLEWDPVTTADGATVVAFTSTATRPPLPAVRPAGSGEFRLIGADRIPANFPSPAQLVVPEPVTFTAPDGTTVHAQMFRKADGPAKRAAVIHVHGGPPRQMLLGWHYMDYYAFNYAINQYLASRGFIVLTVNYRLGIGYGHAFQNPANAGMRGMSEYQDVLAGAKWLQARPDVDRARVGIWGGSYGGLLTATALARNSDVFAAGVDIHGVHAWNDWQTPYNPAAEASAVVGDGLTQDELIHAARVGFESSPVASVKTWTSPVLLIHADDDRNVMFHQTVDLMARLRAQGVPVEELVIPDDTHHFMKTANWARVGQAAGDYLERLLKP